MINEIALSVSMIDDAGIRSAYITRASDLLGIGREDFTEKVNALRQERMSQASSYQSGQRQYVSRQDPNAYRRATGQKTPADKAEDELRKSEQDLLYLLLKFGRQTLHNLNNAMVGVEKVYEPSVAEYIKQTLQVDGLQITDPVLKKIYDLYFENIQAGDSTTEVERFFMSSMEQEISDTAIEILSSSYRFRSEKIENSVESLGKNLSSVLPRTVYVYKSKVINSRLATLRSKLLGLDPSQEEESKMLTRQIQQLSTIKSRLLREAKFAK